MDLGIIERYGKWKQQRDVQLSAEALDKFKQELKNYKTESEQLAFFAGAIFALKSILESTKKIKDENELLWQNQFKMTEQSPPKTARNTQKNNG